MYLTQGFFSRSGQHISLFLDPALCQPWSCKLDRGDPARVKTGVLAQFHEGGTVAMLSSVSGPSVCRELAAAVAQGSLQKTAQSTVEEVSPGTARQTLSDSLFLGDVGQMKLESDSLAGKPLPAIPESAPSPDWSVFIGFQNDHRSLQKRGHFAYANAFLGTGQEGKTATRQIPGTQGRKKLIHALLQNLL